MFYIRGKQSSTNVQQKQREFSMTVKHEDTCQGATGNSSDTSRVSTEKVLLRGGSQNQLSVDSHPQASCSGKNLEIQMGVSGPSSFIELKVKMKVTLE